MKQHNNYLITIDEVKDVFDIVKSNILYLTNIIYLFICNTCKICQETIYPLSAKRRKRYKPEKITINGGK